MAQLWGKVTYLATNIKYWRTHIFANTYLKFCKKSVTTCLLSYQWTFYKISQYVIISHTRNKSLPAFRTCIIPLPPNYPFVLSSSCVWEDYEHLVWFLDACILSICSCCSYYHIRKNLQKSCSTICQPSLTWDQGLNYDFEYIC